MSLGAIFVQSVPCLLRPQLSLVSRLHLYAFSKPFALVNALAPSLLLPCTGHVMLAVAAINGALSVAG